MSTRSAVIVLLLSLGASTAHAETLEQIFQRGNAAYFRGDYDAAAREYDRLLAAGVVDPDVSYNLASAEARRGRHGVAIQHFERTLFLRPGDDDAERGLEAVRAALGRARAESRGEAEVEAGTSLGEALFFGISPGLLAVSALLFDVVFFALLTGLLFVRIESRRLALGIAVVVSGAVLVLSTMGVAAQSGWLEEGEKAVIVGERAPLREGPDRHASERHRALEGQRAWVLDRDRDWLRVRVPSVGEGWIESDQIGLVRPAPR